jgi:hypothetical protein
LIAAFTRIPILRMTEIVLRRQSILQVTCHRIRCLHFTPEAGMER